MCSCRGITGYGAQVIKQFFDPDEVTATDLDPRLISKARSRVVDPSISFDVADASRLPYSDEQFDAIFDFAAIHHIPEWKECLRELRRVVRTGGRIFMIDCPIESFGSFLGRLARIYTSHPYGEMFSEAEFINLLSQLDFKVCFCGTCFARTCTTSSWWWRSDYLAILGHHLQLKPAVSMIYNANCAAPMNPGRRIEGNRG